MTELERKALMGDQEAQKECTKKGIVLPCPCCGCGAKLYTSYDGMYIVQCAKCGCGTLHKHDSESVIVDWNRRPSPPIGRCGECKNAPFLSSRAKGMRWCRKFRSDVNSNDFCSYFEPKERDRNELD